MAVDILLVNPLFLAHDPVERRLMTPYFPLGLLYLAAVLREAGYSVALYDGMFRPGPEDFAAALDAQQPRLVGLGVLSTVRAMALRLAELAQARGIPVIVGGADPTARPEAYLLHQAAGGFPIGVAVVGEGEETILELVPRLLGREGALELEAIRGLAYRAATGEVVHTPLRPLRREVDALPIPARDLLDVESYRRAWRAAHGLFSLSLLASRGCPYECAWCQKGVFGRSFRPRAPERVAAEMREIKEHYAPDQLRIVDDVMGIDRRWLQRFRDAVRAQEARIPFECLSRADLVDEEMLHWLQEAGCMRIAFGAESGSQRVLDAMHKGTRVEQLRDTARLCHQLGIRLYFYIMVGYPGEEWADLQATIALLRETLPDEFSSTIAYPLPGTPFFEQVRGQLVGEGDWQHTAENRLLYHARYHSRFYRWMQRLLHLEWRWARRKRGQERAGMLSALRLAGALLLARGMVRLLRALPPDLRAVPTAVPAH
jgi:radical SAM superfamily enzyme YgiQ (UPF0313 family)